MSHTPLRWSLALLLAGSAAAQTTLFEQLGSAPFDRFGAAVASVGDVDGDGAPDWAAGAPFDDTAGADAGAVTLYSGASQQVLHTWYGAAAGERLGMSIAGAGDLDGDSLAEVVAGAPGAGLARVYSSAGGGVLHTLGPGGATGFGQSVAGGGELDGDGVPDLIVGEPNEAGGGMFRGRVRLYSGATGTQIIRIDGTGNYDYFGWSVAFVGDVDGDLRDEFVAGAPGTITSGSTYARAFDGATQVELWTDVNPGFSQQHGFAVASIGDLSGDGRRDVLIGAPQDPGVGCGGCLGKGYVRAVDGLSGAQLYQVNNTQGSYVGFGSAIAVVGDLDGNGFEDFASSLPGTPGCSAGGLDLRVLAGESGALLLTIPTPPGLGSLGSSLAFGDANGDGLRDLLCGAPCSDQAGAFAGSVHVFTLVLAATAYCEAQTNSQGCTPSIFATGTPSLTANSFRVKAQSVLNNKVGLLFWGTTPQQKPFGGGFKCVVPPTVRTKTQNSGGNPPPDDCSGLFSFHWNSAYVASVGLSAGDDVYCQYWSRDPASSSTTNLTDALAFQLLP